MHMVLFTRYSVSVLFSDWLKGGNLALRDWWKLITRIKVGVNMYVTQESPALSGSRSTVSVYVLGL